MRILLVMLLFYSFYLLQEKFYLKRCLRNVHVEVKFDKRGIFDGETANLQEVFTNRKWLPLWMVNIRYILSRHLIFNDDKKIGDDNYVREIFSLKGYQRVTKTHKITAAKRGFYKIDTVSVNSADFFGINKISCDFDNDTFLYVYPKLINPLQIDIVSKRFFIDIIMKKNILEDQFQLRGIREYYPYDSMKTINWKATARTGETKVNQYENTSQYDIFIFLNMENYDTWIHNEILEGSISMAASLATFYIRKGINVGIISNGCDMLTGNSVRIPMSKSVKNLAYLYENLAKLNAKKFTGPMVDILNEEASMLKNKSIYIIISSYYGKDMRDEVGLLKKKGIDVKWIIPKLPKDKVDVEKDKDLFIWEVRDI